MNKILALLLVITGLMLVSNITYLALQSRVLSHQVSIVCREHRVLAEVAKEEVDSVVKANEKYLRPDVNIPGLTHAELIQSTDERLNVLNSHVTKLEAVRKATC